MITGINRQQILTRFEEWLDRTLSAEDPPAGLDAEILAEALADSDADAEPAGTDSYALWSAMTALSQEVKLQGRAFKELSAAVGTQSAAREREIQREAERRCRKEVLGSLIDLRDRLERGIESAKTSLASKPEPPPRTWLERLVLKPPPAAPAVDPAVAALVKGYELGLDRLDQTLEDFNARPIRCLGQPFDPRRMNAIDKQESDSVPEGTVLEVYRSGYEWNGEVFRTAQVKVAVRPLAPEPTA